MIILKEVHVLILQINTSYFLQSGFQRKNLVTNFWTINKILGLAEHFPWLHLYFLFRHQNFKIDNIKCKNKLRFFNSCIFATRCQNTFCIFNFCTTNSLNFEIKLAKSSGCKNKRIIKLEFVAKTQYFL